MIRAVLFDLDGTLVDTLTDLNDAVNYVLKKYSHKTVEAKDFCKMLGIFDAIKRFYHITIKGDWKKHHCNNKICRWCGRYE